VSRSELGTLGAELALHEIDVVLSDSPVTPSLNMRVYSHYLGDCGVVWMAPPRLAKLYRKGFPKIAERCTRFASTDDTAIRRKLDQWFAGLEIEPKVIGEFEDFALLRVFGQAGAGILPVPTTLESNFTIKTRFIRLGPHETYMAVLRNLCRTKLRHPGVVCDL